MNQHGAGGGRLLLRQYFEIGARFVIPIAIIGIGCRFPGASGPGAFWKLLSTGADAVREVPADRWDARAFFSSDPNEPGKTVSRWGGFVDDLDQFDFEFFGISSREAPYLDPQQRLILEVTWEAFEDAGLVLDKLAGSKTGVFVGLAPGDYGRLLMSKPEAISPYTNTGNLLSIAANRISYLFDLRGRASRSRPPVRLLLWPSTWPARVSNAARAPLRSQEA